MEKNHGKNHGKNQEKRVKKLAVISQFRTKDLGIPTEERKNNVQSCSNLNIKEAKKILTNSFIYDDIIVKPIPNITKENTKLEITLKDPNCSLVYEDIVVKQIPNTNNNTILLEISHKESNNTFKGQEITTIKKPDMPIDSQKHEIQNISDSTGISAEIGCQKAQILNKMNGDLVFSNTNEIKKDVCISQYGKNKSSNIRSSRNLHENEYDLLEKSTEPINILANNSTENCSLQDTKKLNIPDIESNNNEDSYENIKKFLEAKKSHKNIKRHSYAGKSLGKNSNNVQRRSDNIKIVIHEPENDTAQACAQISLKSKEEDTNYENINDSQNFINQNEHINNEPIYTQIVKPSNTSKGRLIPLLYSFKNWIPFEIFLKIILSIAGIIIVASLQVAIFNFLYGWCIVIVAIKFFTIFSYHYKQKLLIISTVLVWLEMIVTMLGYIAVIKCKDDVINKFANPANYIEATNIWYSISSNVVTVVIYFNIFNLYKYVKYTYILYNTGWKLEK